MNELRPNDDGSHLLLAPGFSQVMSAPARSSAASAAFGQAAEKPLKRFLSQSPLITRLKPGANEIWPRVLIAVACLLMVTSARAQFRIPASTAYTEPDANGARISANSGITGWTDPNLRIVWFGNIQQPATIEAAVELRLPERATCRLRLTVAGKSSEVKVKGGGTNTVLAKFGSFRIREPGYQRFTLESLNDAPPFGDPSALVLSGLTTNTAHFNLKPRRNAASVHLRYPVPRGTNVAAFYCEMTGIEDPIHTYYMACGWHRGYFGMQVNSRTERRIIFSVWDSGGEAVDRQKVGDDNRVKLVAKGEGVNAGDFGNEGTGGHSHLKYNWKTGEPQRFIVTAQPTNGTFTIYSGYWFHPEKKEWMLISSWRAPKDGGYLRGLYSFSENFVGSNGHLRRKALYGNQWIRTETGQWIELTESSFSYDSTGRADRLDRFMGVENGQFFLSHGGFVPGTTKSGEQFMRPATGKGPVIQLPAVTEQ